MMLPQLKYSIQGWNKEIYSWVYVPNFKAENYTFCKAYSDEKQIQ